MAEPHLLESTDDDLREADVNAVLGRWLDGAGRMLRTDHVELRRWLVDTGLLWRDGYGRVYRRGPAERGVATEWLGRLGARAPEAIAAAIATLRDAEQGRRAARRMAHAARIG